MKNPSRSMQTTFAGLGALVMLASPGLAASSSNVAETETPIRLAHMGQGQGMKQGGLPCQRGTMGSGMMAPGMGGQGMMGPGMMGSGMMGRGMMPQGMTPPGMRGQGMMNRGAGLFPGFGGTVVPSQDLTVDDVRHFLEHRIELQGNERLKVGTVEEKDENTIAADITTVDDSLVKRIEVNRHTGQMQGVN